MLMSYAEQESRLLGHKECLLTSTLNAVEFYEKLGYTKIEKIPDEKYGTTIKMYKML